MIDRWMFLDRIGACFRALGCLRLVRRATPAPLQVWESLSAAGLENRLRCGDGVCTGRCSLTDSDSGSDLRRRSCIIHLSGRE
ncbi:hypothetical protein AOLI_G00117940 [Acnodon oligacanthus]